MRYQDVKAFLLLVIQKYSPSLLIMGRWLMLPFSWLYYRCRSCAVLDKGDRVQHATLCIFGENDHRKIIFLSIDYEGSQQECLLGLLLFELLEEGCLLHSTFNANFSISMGALAPRARLVLDSQRLTNYFTVGSVSRKIPFSTEDQIGLLTQSKKKPFRLKLFRLSDSCRLDVRVGFCSFKNVRNPLQRSPRKHTRPHPYQVPRNILQQRQRWLGCYRCCWFSPQVGVAHS